MSIDNESTIEFDIYHINSDEDSYNMSAPTMSELYTIDGGPILIMDENNKPLH